MSSAADIEVWNSATQAFDSGSLEEAINQFMSMGTISAKISFNIGSALLAQENIKDALEVCIPLSSNDTFLLGCTQQ